MAAYRFHVQQICGHFEGCEFHHVPRANNEAADALAKIGSTLQAIPAGIALEHLRKPSIAPSPNSDSIFVLVDPQPAPVPVDSGASQPDPGALQPDLGASQPDAPVASVFEIKAVPSWAQEFISYLADGELPEDQVLARQIVRHAKAYTIIKNQLYKRSIRGVFQRCVQQAEGRILLKEIHQGECGHHASSRAIVAKAFRHGFYWPTTLKDAEEMVRACNGCQRFSKQRTTLAAALKTIPVTWPFAVWCLDMAGCWIEELPAVLWSLRTTPNRSTGFTPFFLGCGAKAVLPTDIEHDAPRIALYTEEDAKEAREDGVDLLEEAHQLALSRSAICQQSLRRYHSRRVRPLAFREGDLVLHLIQRTTGMHKLSPPWEGPFIISKALGNNAYYLIDAQEARKNKPDRADEETKRPWNANLLCPFYT
ncbi:hypothetical protein ACQ4PT_010658 [Festuca glaucescens]